MLYLPKGSDDFRPIKINDVQDFIAQKKMFAETVPSDITIQGNSIIYNERESTAYRNTVVHTPYIMYEGEEYSFELPSLAKTVRLLDSKAQISFLSNLSSDTRITVIRDMLSRYKAKLVFRTRANKSIFATVTPSYKAVSHLELYNIIKDLTKNYELAGENINTPFYASCNYRFSSVRIPISKIDHPTKKLFGGIEFSNGQDGNRKLQIRFLVFEQVCTNGMIGNTRSYTFIDSKHTGSLPSIDALRLKHWFRATNEIAIGAVGRMLSTNVKDVTDYVLKQLPKKYKEISGEMASKMMTYLKDRQLVDNNNQNANVFDIIGSLTSISQSFNSERRYELDELAFTIMDKDWL